MQRRHLEELVKNNVGISLPLHVNDDAHTLPSRLVVGIADAVELSFLYEVGDIFYELRLVYAIGNFRYYNLIVRLSAFNLRLCTHHNTSPARLVCVFHALYTIYICTRREVGSLDMLHKSVRVNVRIVYICTASVDNLAEVMCRNIGCHTHGNAVSAVNKKVGKLGRHHRRLLQGVVKVAHHVDGVLVKVVHYVLTHL